MESKKRDKTTNLPWSYLSSIMKSFCLPEVLAAGDTHLVVARAAIDGAIILGQEWYLRLGSALSANHCVHFSVGALCTVCSTARRATACGTA